MNIVTLKPTKGTYNKIKTFLFENKETLSQEKKNFYSDLLSVLDYNLTKPAKHRPSMIELKKRVENIEQSILNSGALSYETINI